MEAEKRRLWQIKSHLDQSTVIKVCVTGAAGQIGYAILPLIARGLMLGAEQRVWLNLLDIPEAQQALQGVAMELQDCAFPLLTGVTIGDDPKQLFKDCQIIIFVGGFPRKAGMERKELISKNVNIFKTQGQALNEVGRQDVKCLVVANPANTNCLALATYASNIPKKNFSCLTRLDQNRAIGQLSEKSGQAIYKVQNAVIWGNHSLTQYPDVNQATIGGAAARQVINNDSWLDNEFMSTVQKRGAAIIAARKLSSAMSAASAAVDHVRDWYFGTQPGEWVSMGVISNGEYGVPEGLVFSYPVTCNNFDYQIVQGINLDKRSLDLICTTTRELAEEAKEGLGN